MRERLREYMAKRRQQDPDYCQNRQPHVWDDQRRDGYHRRKAIKKGASTGRPVLLTEIASRDDWTCGICEGHVDHGLIWPDPLSPSLDHILPLSLGGPHDPDNVQLAHLRCNVRKGAKVSMPYRGGGVLPLHTGSKPGI
ncbi:MAG TPA: HNH endonuclease [Solirubrobacterales bacterium]|nr:HNH endonuclease [Solirubrobacterales bacterium]